MRLHNLTGSLTATLLLVAPPALAGGGVIEINQAAALAGGVTASDTPGFPVTLDTAGSYVLTGNLTVPDENTDGIVVSANDISIDLNGFAIIGPVTCSTNPVSCSHPSGTGSGVERVSSSNHGTSVKNGSISGMGKNGVFLGRQAEVTNLRVRWNRLLGIYASYGSTVSGNTAYNNGDDGIYAWDGSTVSGNSVYYNGGNGIQAESGSTVSGNTVSNNGGDGIYAYSGSTVSGNTVRGNTGYGLRFGGFESAYSENVISGNTAGTVNGSAVQLGQNACDGNTTCP